MTSRPEPFRVGSLAVRVGRFQRGHTRSGKEPRQSGLKASDGTTPLILLTMPWAADSGDQDTTADHSLSVTDHRTSMGTDGIWGVGRVLITAIRVCRGRWLIDRRLDRQGLFTETQRHDGTMRDLLVGGPLREMTRTVRLGPAVGQATGGIRRIRGDDKERHTRSRDRTG